MDFILLHIDEAHNRILFKNKSTDSILSYDIAKESWLYICKAKSWNDFAPMFGVRQTKKRKKKNG